jgi:hypothetical protein
MTKLLVGLLCVLPPRGNIMSQNQAIETTSVQPTLLRCRFEMTAADAPSSEEFCAFELPGCEGCPNALHAVKTVGSTEDPMKSKVLREWIARASRK